LVEYNLNSISWAEEKENPKTKNGRSNLPLFKVCAAVGKIGTLFSFAGVFVSTIPLAVPLVTVVLGGVAEFAYYAGYRFDHDAAALSHTLTFVKEFFSFFHKTIFFF
jgi:hypothetical protein